MDQTVDWWARGIGVAALLIALGGLAWNLCHTAVRDRAKLAIEVSLSIVGWGPRTISCVAVEAFNVGRRPLTVANCTFDTGHKRRLFFMPGMALTDPLLGSLVDESHKVPKRLEEGASHNFLFPMSALQKSMAGDPSVELKRAVVKDGSNHEWKRPVPRNIRKAFRAQEANETREEPVTQI